MDNNELTLYDKIINNIPSYVKNSLSAIGVVIFTALVLYLFHTVATSYRLALYTEIGAPYFTQTINLWSFYLFHVDLLLIVIVSLIFFIGFYILGGLGAVNPKKNHIYEYFIYNLFLALVVFAFFISSKDNSWLFYILSVVVFTVIMSVLQYSSDKAKQSKDDNSTESKDDNSTESKDDNSTESKYKLVAYFIILFIVPIALFYPFVGIFSFNTYFANSFGRDSGQILLESIKNDEYIDKKEGAIIKSSGEHVYPLSCDSLCFIVKKNEKNELFFEFIDSKDLIFTRS